MFRCFVVAALLLPFTGSTFAQEARSDTLAEVRVEAESESDETIQGPYLPPVQGTRIFAGKKTSVLDLDEFPRIANNNYRQALAKTPGLFISEETSPLVSIGYRGLDPHRVQFTQVLRDGIPIHADQFGYPESYFTPPLDTVDRIEFFRGGAALLFGPQPGGALNYVTHRPRIDRPFSFGTAHTFGSWNYYSNFSYADGTVGRVGYYAYFNHRSSDGFRTANSDFDLNAGSIKLVLDATTDSRWILSFDIYEEQHGEPGGLTFATGPNAVNYDTNRNAASRLFDVFELQRWSGSLAWERDFSEDTRLTLTAWGGYYSRYSARQRGGGFGTLPTGPTANSNTIEHQEFYTQGFEGRLRHDYPLFGGKHTVTGGVQAYHTYSPREDRRGATANARDGVLRNDSEREVFYLPVFVENRFKWGNFSLTPGVRLENVWQGVTEHLNLDKTAAGTPLADKDEHRVVPLFGLGVAYEFTPRVELYGNLSQSYRPKIYTQTVPTGGTTIVPEDLRESRAIQYEIGFRGNPTLWLQWDASVFLMEFDDQIGSIALPGGRSTLANVGRAQHRGVEAAAEVDLLGIFASAHDALLESGSGSPKDPKRNGQAVWSFTERYGTLSLYGNLTLLDAEFVSGPLDGRTPRYAPDHIVRTGLIYRLRDRLKVAFLGTFTGDSFADDANTPQWFVPASTVWDLTAEARIYKDVLSVHAGINNLFDEDYYLRIRADGIDPAPRRNFTAGLSLKF
jgi:Fe(3+) dicitrate transport protein